jgi:hypothetical protein
MARPVVAIVTGFTKNPQLPGISLAPLRALKQRGVVQRIIALTWDKPEIDPFVAPLAAMDDVELIRVPEPHTTGGRYQTGVVYQIRNLEAALRCVPDPNSLIVKIRPDFIADLDFLEDKITQFDLDCAPSKLAREFGVKMPPSPFAMKIWIPWATANQPFFFEDAAFMGLKRDVTMLASREAERHLGVLADRSCGWFAHVVRFAMPFLRDFPIFEKYMRDFRYFPNDLDYRMALLPTLAGNAFFWHLVVAHAWILATSFHVDCGLPGDLLLYTNISNPNADWSSLGSLAVNPPYNKIAEWRGYQQPGGMMPCTMRAYGRLVDDSWQHALFTTPVLRDLSPDNLRGLLRNIAHYKRGVLADAETDFFRHLSSFHRQHWQQRAA